MNFAICKNGPLNFKHFFLKMPSDQNANIRGMTCDDGVHCVIIYEWNSKTAERRHLDRQLINKKLQQLRTKKGCSNHNPRNFPSSEQFLLLISFTNY